jgi:hypothetical protein
MNRKEAIRNYKEQKRPAGAFAVRCTATGSVWVGSTPNLDAINNRIWFGLRLGSHIDKSMQREWNEHGDGAFEFEILETLDDDVIAMALPGLLKEKKTLWIQKLSAQGTM